MQGIRHIFEKANRIGTLYLILSITFFTIGMALVSVSFDLKKKESIKIKNENLRFLIAEQEERRNNPYYGMLAAILAPINDTTRRKADSILPKIDSINLNKITLDLFSGRFKDFKFEIKQLDPSTLSKSVAFNGQNPIILETEENGDKDGVVLIPQTEYSCNTGFFISTLREIFEEEGKFAREQIKNYNEVYDSSSLSICISKNTWTSIIHSLIVQKISFKKYFSAFDFPQVFFEVV